MPKQKCNECGKQMHPRHTNTNGTPAKVYYGKDQDRLAYICPLGHTKYVKVV